LRNNDRLALREPLIRRLAAGHGEGDVTAAHGDVVIGAGTGQAGLIPAGGLALAGVRRVVLERRDAPRAGSRAICLHARSLETLALRGRAEVPAQAGPPVPALPPRPRNAPIGVGGPGREFPYLRDIPHLRDIPPSPTERLAGLRQDRLPMTAARDDPPRGGMPLMFPFRNGFCHLVRNEYARADVPETGRAGSCREARGD
jgi:FAD binding domain